MIERGERGRERIVLIQITILEISDHTTHLNKLLHPSPSFLPSSLPSSLPPSTPCYLQFSVSLLTDSDGVTVHCQNIDIRLLRELETGRGDQQKSSVKISTTSVS